MAHVAEDRVTLTLEGERARAGVSLAAFNSFLGHFLRALLYHDRATREASVIRPGRPLGEEELATAFRLVEFRTGSGIAVLEPLLPSEEEAPILAALPPTRAWNNLGDLLENMRQERSLDPNIVVELRAALKALGANPSLSIDLVTRGQLHAQRLDEERLARLAEPSVNAELEESSIALVGVLHAIDLEPDRVAIRTSSGADWTCVYPPDLETIVLALVGRRVWAEGVPTMRTMRGGTLVLDEIHELATDEQSSLFTGPPISTPDLLEQQGLTAPQGLATFADPEWEDNEESELFISAVLGDEQ